MGLLQQKAEEQRSFDENLKPNCENDKEMVTEGTANVKVKKEATVGFSENALNCFGWNEEKVDKWLAKMAKAWYCVMSFLWFAFGALTFAPIKFITNEVNRMFDNKRKSLFVGTCIYAVIIVLVVVLVATIQTPTP